MTLRAHTSEAQRDAMAQELTEKRSALYDWEGVRSKMEQDLEAARLREQELLEALDEAERGGAGDERPRPDDRGGRVDGGRDDSQGDDGGGRSGTRDGSTASVEVAREGLHSGDAGTNQLAVCNTFICVMSPTMAPRRSQSSPPVLRLSERQDDRESTE